MKLYSWGANTYGQLSHGVQSEQCMSPAEVVTSHPLEEVVSIAAGGCHSLVLNSSGSLFGSGSNNNGQLADCQNNTTVFSKLEALQEFKIAKIECGWESSFAITDEGSVLAWGSNKYGQLGISKQKVKTTKHPVVLGVPPIVQLAAGLRHTVMLTSDGQVLTCGKGSKGQLGILDSDGKVPKEDFDSLVKVKGVEDVLEVACGQHHTLALTRGGQVWGWGENRRGQLGEGPLVFPTPRLLLTLDIGTSTTIRAGWTHSAILSGGKVMTWGRNNYSQLGHSYGEEQVDKPTQLTGLGAVKQLELGSEHNLALLDNGEVCVWGWNEHGNCGTGSVDNIPAPRFLSLPSPSSLIAAGAGHSLALCLP